jgi:hypothetical protein
MSEQELVNSILFYITLMGGVSLRINSGVRVIKGDGGKTRVFRGAPKGTSDILCCWRGRFCAIECKVGKNTASPEQLQFIEDVKAAGGIGFVTWDLETVQRTLESIF